MIVLVKDYGKAEANGIIGSDYLVEHKFKQGDKAMIGKVFELTKDIDLANALYAWSLTAEEDEHYGFFKEKCYSGEVEVIV